MAEELSRSDPVTIGPFRLIKLLGEGGMGRVYQGQSPGGRLVAIKVIRQEYADDLEFRARFRQEITAAQRVSGLYTAAVVSADADANPPWFATAFVAGPSLTQVVAERGPLSTRALLDLAGLLAEALQAIHAAGIVHRDLKPSNVLMAEDGPRVIDFGISRSYADTGLTLTGQVIGTPHFMSPEQIEGGPVSAASDVFSLGSVLAFAATGALPFGGGEVVTSLYRIVGGEPNLSAVPELLRPLVASCLAKDPGRRPSTEHLLVEIARLRLSIEDQPSPDAGRDGWTASAGQDTSTAVAGSWTVYPSPPPAPGSGRASARDTAMPVIGPAGRGSPAAAPPRRRWLGLLPRRTGSHSTGAAALAGAAPSLTETPVAEPTSFAVQAPAQRLADPSPVEVGDGTTGLGHGLFSDAGLSGPQIAPPVTDDALDPGLITSRVEFFTALNEVRQHAQLSCRELAALSGLPVSTVRGYFERNRLPAERDVLRQILSTCGVPAAAVPDWEVALVRVRSQRQRGAPGADSRARARAASAGRVFEPGGQPDDESGEDADLLFRVYIPKTQLYAEQRRDMLRLFREWLTGVQGQDIRQQDISSRDGDTVAFFAVPGQPRPPLPQEYRDFVSFVEHCANSPSTATSRLAESGIGEVTSSHLVTKYAKEYHRMDLDLRQARETRILTLQHTLEAELLEKDADPRTIASLRIRSVLEQVVPPPSAAPSLPAIAAADVTAQPTQLHVSFNAEQIVYTAIGSIQGTANFGPQAKELLSLIDRYGGADAGPLRTALHEVEDPGVPSRLRSDARKKLTSFLTDVARQIPGIGVDLLQKYLERQLGLPGS